MPHRFAEPGGVRAAKTMRFKAISVSAFSTAVMLASAPLHSESAMLDVAPEPTIVTQGDAAPVAAQPVPAPPPAALAPPPSSAPAPPPSEPETPPVAGEVVVTGRTRTGDPLQDVNVASFNVAQGVDKAVIGPAAEVYRKGIPKPARKGLSNFLNNLREPVVFLNYVLQLKFGKAGETAGRFAVNSTIGLAGLLDVAKKKPFFLPRRRNGFANTLGFYGVKPGPFFFAPLIGPTTLRDLFGNFVDQAVPIGPIRPFRGRAYTIPVAVLSALDHRAEFDDELDRQRATADPYTAARKYYLERRQAEIDALRGRNKKPKLPAPPKPVSQALPVPDAVPAPRPLLGPPA